MSIDEKSEEKAEMLTDEQITPKDDKENEDKVTCKACSKQYNKRNPSCPACGVENPEYENSDSEETTDYKELDTKENPDEESDKNNTKTKKCDSCNGSGCAECTIL